MFNEDEIRELIAETLVYDDPQFVMTELLGMVSRECLAADDQPEHVNEWIKLAARDVQATNIS